MLYFKTFEAIRKLYESVRATKILLNKFFIFHRRKKIIQVQNDMRVSKSQNFHFLRRTIRLTHYAKLFSFKNVLVFY